MSPANDSAPQLQRYVDILLERGVAWGLLGPREGERIWDRHIANSLALVDLIPRGATVVDVGSGAGLPGLPLAIVRPDLSLTLLEPLLRRSNFLTETVEDLGLGSRVVVVRGRAEEHSTTYDVVTARAVAPLGRLLDWCLPLVKPDGVLLALKGRSAADELATVQSQLRVARRSAEVLVVRAGIENEPTQVVRVS